MEQDSYNLTTGPQANMQTYEAISCSLTLPEIKGSFPVRQLAYDLFTPPSLLLLGSTDSLPMRPLPQKMGLHVNSTDSQGKALQNVEGKEA